MKGVKCVKLDISEWLIDAIRESTNQEVSVSLNIDIVFFEFQTKKFDFDISFFLNRSDGKGNTTCTYRKSFGSIEVGEVDFEDSIIEKLELEALKRIKL